MADPSDAQGSRPDSRMPAASARVEHPRPADSRRLLEGLARGDHAALTALYHAWFPRALGLARAMTRRDESFCLDVVQETFVRIIDHAPRLNRLAACDDLDRWIAAVVRSAAIDLLRRDLRRMHREQAVRRGSAADLSRHDRPSSEDVLALIADLKPDDRELLLLRFGRGTTLNGAARAVGTTVGAAYGRIRRALERLGESLQEVDHE